MRGSVMEIGDLATWVTGGITALGVLGAGYQLRLAERQHRRVRRIDIDGVAVTWQDRDVPKNPDAEGFSSAPWTFTAHNPGDLPIRDVSVRITFACEVQRRHHNGDT